MTLEDAFSGKEEEVSFKKWASCESCHGSGMKPGTQRKACSTCEEGDRFSDPRASFRSAPPALPVGRRPHCGGPV